jgi:hypothetical protein
MMTLVDDESGFRDGGRVDLVCVKKVDEFGFGELGLGGWGEAKIVCGGTRCSLMSAE